MSQLKNRLARIEAAGPQPGHEPITEIHRVIVNADRTPAMKPDGTPWIIVRKVAQCLS
jgi:hypothetical protein